MSTFSLLKEKRFLPFFVVQFAGAFNDNLFKTVFLTILVFKAASEAEAGVLSNLGAGLFILPFLLFSPVAGQLADKWEKGRLIRLIKAIEIGIMLCGALGFYLASTPLLFITLFAMGTRSAFFGPVKYSILPQHLKEEELMAGNSLVETGTFLAILVGELLGGVLAEHHNMHLIAGAIMGVSIIGWLCAMKVPHADPADPGLKISFAWWSEMKTLYRVTRQREGVWNSILGISWFWWFGATMLAQLPSFAKHVLHCDESMVPVLLAVFSLSIGIGSILCERLSRSDIELGLVPLGAIGMTVFTVDLFFVNYGAAPIGALPGARAFLSGAAGGQPWRVLGDLAAIGIFSSFFIVPMYAFLQQRSEAATRSRLIAANNVFNSVFMVSSALANMMLAKAGLGTLQIFLVTALLNAAVSAYVFTLIPEFFMRFVCWILASTIYRLHYAGRDLVPRTGPVLIVANHVSFIDWFVITAACRRPVRFVMDHRIFKTPGLGLLFRLVKAIPIAPAKEDAQAKEEAFKKISAELRDDQVVCIFPEGMITHTGEMNKFRPGVEKILAQDPVPVVAIGLGGLWGSFFSRKGGAAMKKVPHPSRRHISVKLSKIAREQPTAAELETTVQRLIA